MGYRTSISAFSSLIKHTRTQLEADKTALSTHRPKQKSQRDCAGIGLWHNQRRTRAGDKKLDRRRTSRKVTPDESTASTEVAD